MTSVIRTIVRQRAAVILFAIILLAAGGFTATRLQEELLPNVSFNTVTIVTAEPGASPGTVLNDVTKPIEVAVAGVPGINTLASTSAQNASVVTVQFNYGTDINGAESKISTAVSGLPLPNGAQAPKVSTVDFSAFPILYLGVNNKDSKASLQDIYTLVNGQVKPQLDQLSGVAAADVGGGANPRVSVTLDPRKMARYSVTPAQVSAVLQANNVGIPGGNVTAGGVTEPVVTTGRLSTIAQIADLPITVQAPAGQAGATGAAASYPGGQSGGSSGGQGGYGGGSSGGAGSAGNQGAAGGQGNPASTSRGNASGASGAGAGATSRAGAAPRVVLLKDVATVKPSGGDVNVLGATPGQIAGIVRFNGKPAISITIRKNSDANIVKVADAVQSKVRDLEKQYPQLQISTLYDSSTSIVDSVDGLVRDGLFGALFAILVIFLFLRTVRTTLVTAVSIPLSIFTALIILGTQGITLNLMTISAVAVAIGRVVDDAIVVLENIYRHVQEGEERVEAVVNGTREVGRAIIGSTITTIAVFLPIGFVGGIIGQFFQPFAFTVAFALAASLLVALTVIPALGSLFITRKSRPERETAIQRVYTPVLIWALAHRAITVVVALVLFVGSLVLAIPLPKGFLPPSNSNLSQVSVTLPAGASLGRTTAVVARVEREVLAVQLGIKEYESVIGYDSAGAQRSGSGSASNVATLLVVYDGATNMTNAVDRLSNSLTPYQTDGVSIKASTVQNGPPSNVDVQVTGSDAAGVTAATGEALNALKRVKGLTDLQSNLQARQPQLQILVDPRKAFLHGLTPATAALAIRGALTGQTVTTVRLQGQSQDADIYVQVDPNSVNTAAKIERLTIGTPPTTVGAIASVKPALGPVSIARQAQQNIGDVTAGIGSSYSSGAVTGNVTKAIKPLTTKWASRNITVGQGGVGQQLIEGFVNMGIAMLVAIGLVYLIMVVLFRSLLIPFVILFSLPLAVIGALVGLFVTGRTLDLSALIGMLMLIGIVVTNAIVLLDLVQHKIEAGEDLHTALVEGGRTRVRPILMTATATILALVPLAVQTKSSGIIAGNLATVVIGGLLTSTLLTLVVIPVIYSLLGGLRRATGGVGTALPAAGRAPSPRAGNLTPERVAFRTEP